jgi:hypothetical protein
MRGRETTSWNAVKFSWEKFFLGKVGAIQTPHTDGVVIGSKEFVNEAFLAARERFTPKRKGGARVMKGRSSGAKGVLRGVRDLRVRV